MKHILNNISENEKNEILGHYTGQLKIDNSKFNKLVENKLGDVKPLLSEQEQKTLPTISFEETFPMNMVRIHDQSLLTNKMNELDQLINNSIQQEGGSIESISITINAGHSPEAATNGLPQGINEPDHDYEGKLTMDICKAGSVDKCWLPYARNKERRPVPDGNSILAKLRGQNLKAYLQDYISKKYPGSKITINFGEIDKTKRFVNAVINGIVKGKAKPKENKKRLVAGRKLTYGVDRTVFGNKWGQTDTNYPDFYWFDEGDGRGFLNMNPNTWWQQAEFYKENGYEIVDPSILPGFGESFGRLPNYQEVVNMIKNGNVRGAREITKSESVGSTGKCCKCSGSHDIQPGRPGYKEGVADAACDQKTKGRTAN